MSYRLYSDAVSELFCCKTDVMSLDDAVAAGITTLADPELS